MDVILLEDRAQRALSFFEGIPPRHRRRYRKEWMAVFLWTWHQKWTDRAAGEVLGVHPSTLAKRRKTLKYDPIALFDYPLIHVGRSGKTKTWTCLVCGYEDRRSDRRCREHVAQHYVMPELVQIQGVYHLDRLTHKSWVR